MKVPLIFLLICLLLMMDREARRAAVHGVANSRTWLSHWTELICAYTGKISTRIREEPLESNKPNYFQSSQKVRTFCIPISQYRNFIIQGTYSGILRKLSSECSPTPFTLSTSTRYCPVLELMRLQTGMCDAYGKPQGAVARVHTCQVVSICTKL